MKELPSHTHANRLKHFYESVNVQGRYATQVNIDPDDQQDILEDEMATSKSEDRTIFNNPTLSQTTNDFETQVPKVSDNLPDGLKDDMTKSQTGEHSETTINNPTVGVTTDMVFERRWKATA